MSKPSSAAIRTPSIAAKQYQQYRLLSGPYRLAMWALMCRFKTRLIGNAVRDLGKIELGNRKTEAFARATSELEQCIADFAGMKDQYANELASSLEQLFENTPDVFIDRKEVDIARLSDTRVGQIEQYLWRVTELWRRASRGGWETESVFETISESIWPAYGVVYPTGRQQDDKYSVFNFVTWLPTSNLFSIPFISRINPLSDRLRRLCLYPSVVTGGPGTPDVDEIEVLGSNQDANLKKLVDRSSEAFLDFDEQEPVVGMVQKLRLDFLQQKFEIRNLIRDSLLTRTIEETALFTDLFYFFYQGVRYVLPSNEIPEDASNSVEPQRSDAPKGLLFLAGPSITAFCYLLDADGGPSDDVSERHRQVLKAQMQTAWEEVDGMTLTRILHDDMRSLRERLFEDLVSAEKNKTAITTMMIQERAWAHDVKHWTNPILPDLFSALREIPENSEARRRVKRARLHALILNATANARQTSIADQEKHEFQSPTNGNKTSRFFLRLNRNDIRRIVGLVMEVLLQTHADNPENTNRFALRWPDANSLESALGQLADIVPTTGTRLDDHAIIGEAAVLWPLTFLREVVHNIKINDPVASQDAKYKTIDLSFTSEIDGDTLIFRISQNNYEAQRRRSVLLPDGLRMTNALYGPNGANFGMIEEKPTLNQESFTISDPQGVEQDVFYVEYELIIKFFLPPETTAT